MILLSAVDSLKEIWDNPSTLFHPESLIRYGGLFVLFLMVYAQTGLFFCFFLPSGALLFTSGVLLATGELHESVFIVCFSLIIASLLGNCTGYWFGRKAGPILFKRKDSAFFKQEHLAMADSFYRKHGGIALCAGLFLPIIRTFAPIVAGMIKMNFRRFVLYTFAGSALWISSMVLPGFLLGKIPFFKSYLTYIIIGILLIITIPMVIRILRSFKKLKQEIEEKDKRQ